LVSLGKSDVYTWEADIIAKVYMAAPISPGAATGQEKNLAHGFHWSVKVGDILIIVQENGMRPGDGWGANRRWLSTKEGYLSDDTG
jgi:hypothetical protein